VPVQFNEIYTALLRERTESRAGAISANWESMRQKTQLNGTWKYFRTVGKNLGDLSSRTVDEAGIWWKAKRLSWANGRRPRLEPDLVPSMFSLSQERTEIPEDLTPPPQVENVTPIPAKKPFSMWKPVAAGAAAILAVTLWVHGSSHSRLKADQVAKEPSVQAAVPAIQAVQKIEKPDPASASKVLVKSNPDDNYFQEVVVRHFNHPAPHAVAKDGVKRRVVVD
jgi:hypothetical protein